jgi:hypothetical protein
MNHYNESNNTSYPSDTLDDTKEEHMEFRATGRILNILNELRDNYNLSRSEIIRRAIALFFIAKREQKRGNRLVVLNSDDELISEITSI